MPTAAAIIAALVIGCATQVGHNVADGGKWLIVHGLPKTARVLSHPFRHPKKDLKATGRAVKSATMDKH